MGGGTRGKRQRKGEDVVHPLKISLKDLHSGTSRKLSLSRNVIFSKCTGKGTKSGVSMSCSGCKGSGMKVSMRQIGLGMVQQMQHPCNECKGEKVIQEKNILEVHVEKGMQNGQKIKFPREADQAPDTVSGDIVFVVTQKDHPKFKRNNDGLFLEHALSLTKALCGFQFALTHLDVVKPNSFKSVDDEWMPMYWRAFMKGKLYIQFTEKSPQLKDTEIDECEETTLHAVSNEEIKRKQAQARAREAYDEDEDEDVHGGGSAPGVQCTQQ
ncbi:hypothetical protein MKX01_002981 [Papaver californicum]|nr:hypothetical protein MKX01_002981 [Papaver californicum]